MDELSNRFASARRRIALLGSLARFTWVVNGLVGAGALACHRYELASYAGYIFTVSLFLAAYARRAARHLDNLQEVLTSHAPPRSLVAVDTVS